MSESAISTVCAYVTVYVHTVNVCVFLLQSVLLPRYVLTQRLEPQVAPGVCERFTSCWCLSVRCTHTHTHTHTYTHSGRTNTTVYLFVPFLTHVRMYTCVLALTYAPSCHAWLAMHECISHKCNKEQHTVRYNILFLLVHNEPECALFCRLDRKTIKRIMSKCINKEYL